MNRSFNLIAAVLAGLVLLGLAIYFHRKSSRALFAADWTTASKFHNRSLACSIAALALYTYFWINV